MKKWKILNNLGAWMCTVRAADDVSALSVYAIEIGETSSQLEKWGYSTEQAPDCATVDYSEKDKSDR